MSNSQDNPKRLLILLPVLALFAAVAVLTSLPSDEGKAELRIACGGDAAGMAIARAASLYGDAGVEIAFEDNSQVSFLLFADCCGNQAEIALAAGEFDMAVLCPDAAELFLSSGEGEPFVVAGGIVQDANILVTASDGPVVAVGYMNGRELQKRALAENVDGVLEYQPMMAAALPYALEVDAVDGVVLDVVHAVRGDAYLCTPLPYPQASSVLVVREDLIGTEPYAQFLAAYNTAVYELNGDGLEAVIEEFLQSQNSEEMTNLWRKLGTTYLNIPNEESPSAA